MKTEEIIAGGRKYLEVNDLYGFYTDYLGSLMHSGKIPDGLTVGKITKFFEDNGIDTVAEIINSGPSKDIKLPGYFCAGIKVPAAFTQSSIATPTLRLPPQFTHIGPGAFQEASGFDLLDLSGIKQMDGFAFCKSSVKAIKFDKLIKGYILRIGPPFNKCSIDSVYIPESWGEEEIEWLASIGLDLDTIRIEKY